MRIHKFAGLVALLLLAFILVACGADETPTPEAAAAPTEEPMEEPTEEPMEEPTEEPMEEPTEEMVEEPWELRIAVENAYTPFNFYDPDTGEAVGYDYDLFQEICSRIGCEPDFVETSWDAMLAAMGGEAGFDTYDIGADGITITEERAQHVDFSDPYITLSQTLLVRADEDRFANAEEFVANPEWLVGSQTGTTNYDVAVDLVGEDRIVVYDQFPLAVEALKNGDVDSVVMDNVAGIGYVNADPDKVKITGDELTGEELGFIFSQGDPLRDQINEVLAEMDADGTMDELFQKWFILFVPSE